MGKVIINGRNVQSVNTSGNNVIISNNKIFVDGKEVQLPDAKEFNIQIDGNVQELKVDNAVLVTVNGSATTVSTMSGSVNTSGDIGNVKTMSGDVHGKNITGSVSTMSGDINNFGK